MQGPLESRLTEGDATVMGRKTHSMQLIDDRVRRQDQPARGGTCFTESAFGDVAER
jgi:hypothetical protein